MKRSLGPELPSELRAEFDRSRRAGHDYDALAKLPQLRAALAAPQPPADGSSAAPGPGTNASHVAAAAWKVGLLAVVGTTLFGVWYVQRPQRAPVRPPLLAHHAEPAAPAVPTVREAEPTAVEPSAVEPKPSAKAAPANDEVVAATQPAPNPEPAVRSSRREIAQVVRIRALLEHDPAAAYRLAQQADREFPHGVLSEERQALQVLALAKSGATDAASRKAQAFFARYPQSPMRELLEAALRR